jgi:hypothetical protein
MSKAKIDKSLKKQSETKQTKQRSEINQEKTMTRYK